MNEGYIKLIKAIFGFQPISIPPYEQFEITDEEKIVSACDKAIESLGNKQKKALYDVIFEGKEKKRTKQIRFRRSVDCFTPSQNFKINM